MKTIGSPEAAAAKSAHARASRKTGIKGMRQALSPRGLPRFSVKDLASRYRISRDTLTRMTGFSPRALASWSQGSQPSSSTTRRFTEIQRLFTALEKLVSPETIGPWLKEPSSAFNGSTPLQVIERGEADRIWRMVYELQSGEPA